MDLRFSDIIGKTTVFSISDFQEKAKQIQVAEARVEIIKSYKDFLTSQIVDSMLESLVTTTSSSTTAFSSPTTPLSPVSPPEPMSPLEESTSPSTNLLNLK